MSIIYDEEWLPSLDGTHTKRIYRDGDPLAIGRVRLWQNGEEGELTREWFTAERWSTGRYVPLEGEHANFLEAAGRIVFYTATH
ncbi:hypothetical protein [Methylobacterium sp. ID0610]|uniref:hypothetical protein n=1 Tax=Methylobacterium carpenticola TaxID=3344827 RepID=UPI0036AC0BAF